MSELGVCLGVDVGSVRVGVAVSDPEGRLAVPLTTLARDRGVTGRDVDELAALVAERGVAHVVVGLPRTLSGQIGPAAAAARRYAEAVARAVTPVPVHEFDERLTTASVSRSLSRSGISTRRQRPVVDQAAAALILQGWLDQTRRTELTDPPGVPKATSR